MRRLSFFFLACLPVHAATVYMFIGDGQSLAMGNQGCPAISTTQPYANRMWNGSILVPLIENMPCDANPALTQESPDSAAANNLTFLDPSHSFSSIWNNFAVGGAGIAMLTCGTPNYNNMISELASINAAVTGGGNRLVISGVLWTHGETDYLAGSNTYKSDMVTMQACLETSVKQITGQTQGVPWFLSQFSAEMSGPGTASYPAAGGTLYTCPDGTLACVDDPRGAAAPLLAISQWKLQQQYPDKFRLTGPRYQYPSSDGALHLTAQGYNLLGATAARALRYQVLGLTGLPGAVYPILITRVGSVVSATFATPNGLPLTIDTTTLPNPWRNGAYDTVGHGFQFFETVGGYQVEVPLTRVMVVGYTAIITLASTPTGTNQRLAYAFEGQRYASSPEPGVGPDTGTFPSRGAIHGNIRTVNDYTDLNGNAIQHWLITFNEPVL